MLPFEKLIIKEKKMNIIVTYKSKTGFTKKYAQWIAEDLGCKAVSLSELSRVSEYDVVIHGGWIMGGTINGFEEIKKRKNLNAQFKRILQNKAKQMPQNEDGEEFSATITSIENLLIVNALLVVITFLLCNMSKIFLAIC